METRGMGSLPPCWRRQHFHRLNSHSLSTSKAKRHYNHLSVSYTPFTSLLVRDLDLDFDFELSKGAKETLCNSSEEGIMAWEGKGPIQFVRAEREKGYGYGIMAFGNSMMKIYGYVSLYERFCMWRNYCYYFYA